MKLLAIDTSTERATLALSIDGIFYNAEHEGQKTQAHVILTRIETLINEAGIAIPQLDAIVFGQGPGSFTGLRIACSIAKGLAYAHDIKVIPVSNLATIAYEIRQQQNYEQRAVLAVVDARMQQMYWSYFPENSLMGEDRVNAVHDIKIPNKEPLILAGVGIESYWSGFPKELQSQIVQSHTIYPRAETMIKFAIAQQLKAISAAEARPVYVRNQVTQGDSGG